MQAIQDVPVRSDSTQERPSFRTDLRTIAQWITLGMSAGGPAA